jgi:S1-C subfamily serine protease
MSAETLVEIFRGKKPPATGFFMCDKRYVGTVAHCMEANPLPGFYRDHGNRNRQPEVEIRHGGVAAHMVLVGYECCLDLAVLGVESKSSVYPPLRQTASATGALQTLRDTRETARVLLIDPPDGQEVQLKIYTRRGAIICGKTNSHRYRGQTLFYILKTDGEVMDGDSGSPAFTATGEVFGIVSASPDGKREALIIRLSTTIPVWLLRELEAVQGDGNPQG